MYNKDNWPVFGILKNYPVKYNPYFKIQSRKLYVDVPNEYFLFYITHLSEIANSVEGDIDKMYIEFKKFTEKVNNNWLGEEIPWLRFVVRRETVRDRPIGIHIQVRIKWDKFFEFLENFPENNELSLSEKYGYLFTCRRAGLIIALRDRESRIEGTQKMVEALVEKDIDKMLILLDSFCKSLEMYKTKLLRLARRKNVDLLTVEYFPEMISTISSIRNMISNGVVTPCYREMRKILENLCWALFNDVMCLRSVNLAAKLKIHDPIHIHTPYVRISQEWYAKSNELGHTLRHLGDLYKYMKNTIEALYFYSKLKNYSWSKKSIKETIFSNLDYSLIISLTSSCEEKYPKSIPSVDAEQLRMILNKSIDVILSRLKKKSLSKSDKKFSMELTNEILNNKKELVPAFPSNSFVIQFISKNAKLNAKLNLIEFYKNYSFFVHSYPFSWQTFPYSSVLEYKILMTEINKFKSAVLYILDSII